MNHTSEEVRAEAASFARVFNERVASMLTAYADSIERAQVSVTDEAVELACSAYFGTDSWPDYVDEVELGRVSMRAALLTVWPVTSTPEISSKVVDDVSEPVTHPADSGQVDAYAAGWRQAARWADREDLVADIGSPAYERDKVSVLRTSAAEPVAQGEAAQDAEPQSCTEPDGCPTETAVLKRFWRENKHTAEPAQPADSGRVSDEMVERARAAYFDTATVEDGVYTDRIAMRAAVTAALAAQGQGEATVVVGQTRCYGDDEWYREITAEGICFLAPLDQQDAARNLIGRGLAPRPASPAGVSDEWLPIESAPNDGTPHVRGLHVFSSTDGAYLYWDAVVGQIDTEDGQFYDLGGDLSSGWAADDFTHWHPLAAAPSATAENVVVPRPRQAALRKSLAPDGHASPWLPPMAQDGAPCAPKGESHE